MTEWKNWLGQALCYALLFGLIGYLSNSPTYSRYDDNSAMIKLSLRHSGLRLGECHQRSAEELARLPATARALQLCPRERSPLLIELLVDGKTQLIEVVAPRGLHNDGQSAAYFRLPISAGKLNLEVRMKDHLDQADFPYVLQRTLEIKPAQILAIDFDSAAGKFVLM